jgi:O-methyltransferase
VGRSISKQIKEGLMTVSLKLIHRAFFGNPIAKYVSRYMLLDAIAEQWDLKLYNYNVTWFRESEFLEITKAFPMAIPATGKRYNLYHLAKAVRHLDGDTAECGVATGIMSYLIYTATNKVGRHHHVFDSFEGLSEPLPGDHPTADVPSLKKGDYAVSQEKVRENLGNKDDIQFYKGWIPERFSEVDNKRFIFVHIDVDFYQPTIDSLRFFYPGMVKGGIIICDDYGFLNTPGSKQAMDEFLLDKPESLIKLDAGHAFIIKQ